MINNILTVSLVGIFKKTDQIIPVLDKEFCLSLFGKPEITKFGITNNGFTINVENDLTPVVVINQQKISITAKSLDQILEVLEKIKSNLLKETNEQFDFSFSAFGLNSEHEFLDLEIAGANWLSNKFINNAFSKPLKNIISTSCTQVNFRIKLNDQELFDFIIQPRANVSNGIFIGVNHHNEIVLDNCDLSLIQDKFNKSFALLNSEFFPCIITE